jgi:anti-anti-sigma factor
MGRTVHVASPEGELDLSTVEEVDRILQVANGDHMIIDLRRVSFVDSVTLSRFVRAARQHEAAGSRVILADARGPVRRVLSITQLDDVPPDADDVEGARPIVATLADT